MRLLACAAALGLAACAHESWDVVDPAPGAASRALPPGLGLAPPREVAIRTGETKVLGAIDPEAVRKVIRDHSGQVRWCYEQRLAVNPALEGKVSLRWQIGADGHVSNATVLRASTTLPDDAVGACLVERLATWEFPKPSGGGIAIVAYPWILRSSKAPDAPPGASAEPAR